MGNHKHTPASNAPATGEHNPATCPPRHDGEGNSWACTWFDHDAKLFEELNHPST